MKQCQTAQQTFVVSLTMETLCNITQPNTLNTTSPAYSNLGRAASQPLTAQNALVHCMC